jgi:hypothetical protein
VTVICVVFAIQFKLNHKATAILKSHVLCMNMKLSSILHYVLVCSFHTHSASRTNCLFVFNSLVECERDMSEISVEYDRWFVIISSVLILSVCTIPGTVLMIMRSHTPTAQSQDFITILASAVVCNLGAIAILFLFLVDPTDPIIAFVVAISVMASIVVVTVERLFRMWFLRELVTEQIDQFTDLLKRYVNTNSDGKAAASVKDFASAISQSALSQNVGTVKAKSPATIVEERKSMPDDMVGSPSGRADYLDSAVPMTASQDKPRLSVKDSFASRPTSGSMVSNPAAQLEREAILNFKAGQSGWYQQRIWLVKGPWLIFSFVFLVLILVIVPYVIVTNFAEIPLALIQSILAGIEICFLSLLILFLYQGDKSGAKNENLVQVASSCVFIIITNAFKNMGFSNRLYFSVDFVLLQLLLFAHFLTSVVVNALQTYADLETEVNFNLPLNELRSEMREIMFSPEGFQSLFAYLQSTNAIHRLLFIEAVDIYKTRARTILEMQKIPEDDKCMILRNMALDMFRRYLTPGSNVTRDLLNFDPDGLTSVIGTIYRLEKDSLSSFSEIFWTEMPVLFEDFQKTFSKLLAVNQFCRFRSTNQYQVLYGNQKVGGRLKSNPVPAGNLHRQIQDLQNKHRSLLGGPKHTRNISMTVQSISKTRNSFLKKR